MKQIRGVTLIMALVLLLAMSLLISAMLLVSQLSHKAAYAGQQQLQTEQQALTEHMLALGNIALEEQVQSRVMADCPASYAAWSAGTIQCEMLRVDTATYSDSRYFFAGYSSLVVKATLSGEPD